MFLTNYRLVPLDFLVTLYDSETVYQYELVDVYIKWCARHGLKATPEDDASFSLWLSTHMDQLTEDSWMPIATVQGAMHHMNDLIALCAKWWTSTTVRLPFGNLGIINEYAGIIVYEHPEYGDEAPLLVQFGVFQDAPCFQTDCYDVSDIWQALGLRNQEEK